MRFLDTNIFLRYLVKPQSPADEPKRRACFELLQRVKRGEEQVTTCEAVVAEVIYNLCSPRQYRLSHEEASARLRPLLILPGLRLPQKRVYLKALDLFAVSRFLDIEDCLIIAHMEQRGLKKLLSYDTDFDQVATVSRQEP
jgi:predicted nucleic acid-binding protein